MRVLVDTSVWSLALRRRLGAAGLSGEETRAVAALTEAIKDGRAAIIGPVRQEVLSGVKHEAQFEKLSGALAAFPDAPIESRDYVLAARLDNLCRSAGVQCGTVDMLLIALALSNGWTILTCDDGLIRCIEVAERKIETIDPKRRGQKIHCVV